MSKVTIAISRDNKSRLDLLGNKGDSYDDILSRMLDKIELDANWKAFTNMTVEMQHNVVKAVFEADNAYQFSLDSDKSYAGLQYSYYHDERLRSIMNNAMKKLNYI